MDINLNIVVLFAVWNILGAVMWVCFTPTGIRQYKDIYKFRLLLFTLLCGQVSLVFFLFWLMSQLGENITNWMVKKG